MKQPGWRMLQLEVLHKPLLTLGSKGAARGGEGVGLWPQQSSRLLLAEMLLPRCGPGDLARAVLSEPLGQLGALSCILPCQEEPPR